MKKSLKPLVAVLAVVISASALAQQAQPKPETLIKWRQSVYQVLAWNSSRIKEIGRAHV